MLNNIKWLIPSQGEESEIVVSSRIRIARNLEEFPFEIKIKKPQARRLVKLTKSIIESKLDGSFIDFQNIKPLEKESLLECHLVSPAFVKEDRPTGLFISADGKVSIMINEEDHLRIQGLACGLDLINIYSQTSNLEDSIGEDVRYAYDRTYGFITSCPTNLGTGLRSSVLLHLPGLVLTDEIGKVLKGAIQMGMAVRGIYGEGSNIKGNLFQISNQQTLGLKEEDLIETIIKLSQMIIDVEKKARDAIVTKTRYEFEDKVFRSLAVLKSARIISTNEVLNLLSAVRLGWGMGLIKDISLDTINEIMFVSRPANIQLFFGEILEEHERDARRAEYIRKRLGEGKKN
jgi:protein arginine kinase